MKWTPAKPLARLLAGLALITGLVLGAAAPAQAIALPTDRPKLTSSGYDFGRNWDTFGTPLNGGHLYWDVTNGVVSADLEGYLYLKNVSGHCAKIQVIYHNSTGGVLDVRESRLRCASDNSLHQWWVDIDGFGSPFLTHVTVKLNVQNTNGTFTTADQQIWSA